MRLRRGIWIEEEAGKIDHGFWYNVISCEHTADSLNFGDK
jgi:hypothetical protein